MDVEIISTAELGDRSYVVHDGHAAIVVDPQRDLERIEAVLQGCGAALSLVLETHVHNDYVTGGWELARRTGARYALNADDEVHFERTPVRPGDELEAGSLRARAIHTPGHTETHLSYVVSDLAMPGQPPAVFTGGSLQFGTVGRTDLVDVRRTVDLTRAQYHSARRLAAMLPDSAAVYPTHGFGSFCSAGSASTADDSTIGVERASNAALTTEDEQRFVETLIQNLTAYPAYYAHMAPINRRGPSAPDLSPPRAVDPAELTMRLTTGEWVIDLRDRTAYAADHLAGTAGIEMSNDFATYIGWLIPWGSPLTLIGDTAEQIAQAQLQLSRIGIDDLAGTATGHLSDLAPDHDRRDYLRTDFAHAGRHLGNGDVILDVRRDDERREAHITGSAHLPIHDLARGVAALPPGRLWVYCTSGYRASIAASLLERAGRQVALIDDHFDHAAEAGLPITHPR